MTKAITLLLCCCTLFLASCSEQQSNDADYVARGKAALAEADATTAQNSSPCMW